MARQSSVQRWCSVVLLAVLTSLSLWYGAPAIAFRLGIAFQAGRYSAMVDQALADEVQNRRLEAEEARRLSEPVRSAVVRVESLAPRSAPDLPASGDEIAGNTWSCGLIIDPEGRVLTNYDPIAGSREFRIHLSEGRGTHLARLVGGDFDTNLALLRIDPPLESLPVGRLSDGSLPGVGDHVVVVGNALSEIERLCIGIVNCGGRRASAACCCPQDFIHTTAANPGNLGAPLLNQRGEIVAIASACGDGAGGFLGVAIPSGVAMQVVQQLREYGQVRRGWLGAFLHAVPGIPEPDSPAGAIGVAFDYVIPESPAEKAGLDHGDLLIRVSGRPIQSFADLRRIIAVSQPNSELLFSILRGGERIERRVNVEYRPGELAHLPGEVEFGIRLLCHLSSEERRRLGIEIDHGVVIQGVAPGPLASELHARDVIVAVNDVETQSLADYCREVRRWREGEHSAPIRLAVHSQGKMHSIEIGATSVP